VKEVEICSENEKTEVNYPGWVYIDYKEFKLGIHTVRRSKIPQEIKKGVDSYNICEKDKTSERYGSITGFGYIFYNIPIGVSNETLEIMDSIVKTLKKNN